MFPKIIGHRGLPYAAPENTMSSYIAAVDAGADGLEIDIQMTKDGELVLIHDETLDRTTNGSGPVGLCTFKALRRLNADHRFGGQAKIPALREFLERFAFSGLTLIMELKTKKVKYPGIEEKLLGYLNEYGSSAHVIITSFNRHSLFTVKQLDSRMKTGILFKYRPLSLSIAKRTGANALFPQFRNLRCDSVKKLAESGFTLYPFTVNRLNTMRRMIHYRVAGIITDRCDLLSTLKAEHQASDR